MSRGRSSKMALPDPRAKQSARSSARLAETGRGAAIVARHPGVQAGLAECGDRRKRHGRARMSVVSSADFPALHFAGVTFGQFCIRLRGGRSRPPTLRVRRRRWALFCLSPRPCESVNAGSARRDRRCGPGAARASVSAARASASSVRVRKGVGPLSSAWSIRAKRYWPGCFRKDAVRRIVRVLRALAPG